MAMKGLVAFLVAAMVAGSALVVADHMDVVPVSEGGELAYVRDYPHDALETAAAGEHVTATYVGFTFDEHPQKDSIERFESRGRAADSQLFHRVDLADGTFSNLSFVKVDHVERGILLAQGAPGCAAVLNGVNAGTFVYATEGFDARFIVVNEYDVEQVDNTTVDISRDGHTYRLQLTGDGSFDTDDNDTVDGKDIRVSLGPDSQLRGWIIDEYPATTSVMHSEFDHLAEDCAAPAEEPAPEPELFSDAAVDKEVADQDDENVIFSIVTSSEGNTSAANVTMTDELPEGGSDWFIGGDDAEACTLENRTLTCDFGTMEPGESREVTAQVYIRGMCGEFPNTASVSSDDDADATNDEDTAVADLGPCEPEPVADVAVDKEVAEQTEEHVIFSIAVDSVGDLNATNVTLSDELPETHDTWILGGDDSEACELDNRSLSCAFGTLAPGDQRSVELKSYIDEACGPLENTAFVSADEDGNASNDQDTATAQLAPCEEEPAPEENETAPPADNETAEPEENETSEPEQNETAPPEDNETSEPEANETAEEPEAEPFEPRTQGYWKNHPEAWPVEELTLGDETYTKDEALEILHTPPRGDASVILAHQLIAARLNEAAGADASSVEDAMADADAVLAEQDGRIPTGTAASSEDGQTMTALAEELDAWNNSGEDDGDFETQGGFVEKLAPGVGTGVLVAALIGGVVLYARRR